MPLNLKSLVGKLNETCRDAMLSAAGLCVSRTNYNIEIEHWLMKLIGPADSDLSRLFRFYEINPSRLKADLTAALDRLQTGNARPPGLSPATIDLAREAFLAASLEFGAERTRSGHVLYALLSDPALARQAGEISSEFGKVDPAALRKDLLDIVADSHESREAAARHDALAGEGQPGGSPIAPRSGGASRTPSLDQFTTDLTERARCGKLDPVLGRDTEVRQIIDILTRRRQNNPILTGEAGVGKTAVVEGFAQRVAEGDVPPSLREVSVRTLDLGLLQAGAGIKGEFENRLKGVIDEVKASPRPIILFIDEAHMMIGAGGQAEQGDAANLLKPALARGELRTIAATTWAEYKKYFEKDPALARRFQVVKVEEPAEAVAIQMMRGLVGTLEQHHAVRILDEAVVESVRLSHRYISGRQLPDKCVSLLDTACARVAIGHSATPPAIEDARRRIGQLEVAAGILQRESAAGAAHAQRIEELRQQADGARQELQQLNERWEQERSLVGQIRSLREQLEQGASVLAGGNGSTETATGTATIDAPSSHNEPVTGLSDADRRKLLDDLTACTSQLRALQGERPLMQVCVDAQAVAEVVSGWTGIPVGRMISDEIRTVLAMEEKLQQRIIGQTHALEAIARAIRTSRANMTDPRKPIGVFLMVGSSGVGKTETAIALSELLYGGDQNMTVINMSEFKEEHKVSLLMGSPPGYVGYGEGGVLTEAVRRKPYSVLLLDEMEKAHPGVQDIFYQVFDKGMMKDGEGRDIDFKNTLIIMTSNAATDLILKLCGDEDTRPTPEGLAEALHPELLKTFKPAFLGRVTIVPYFPLSDDVMRQIITLQLKRIAGRIQENHKADFTWDDAVIDHIAARCKEVHTGARNVDHILTRTLLPELSAEILARMAEGNSISVITTRITPDGSFAYELTS